MKVTFAATSNGPDFYTFNSESITAYYKGKEETYDLTEFPENGDFTEADFVSPGVTAIREVIREDGELKVVLAQQVIAGQYPDIKAHWRESPVIDADDYDPNKCYVVPTGMAGVDDYEIIQGVDVAGNTGWTVRKKEMADG